ncbi:MAG: LD-carboxypeptidase [Candidatus Omnitrophica bacterium]|jgi:muramoyltetrapeptide carboxypeptidase|nr:LD-carboxypeptidase [Candidatus Omnitrophota bacterium]
MPEHSIIKPKILEKGDTIGVVAPASSFDPNNFARGLQKLESLGYQVKYERCIFSPSWSKDGQDRKRAEQINRMFADKKVKAIFCAKAGYGSMNIIPFIDKDIIRGNPKIFVGYSDITALLLYLQKVGKMVVFHGPVISNEIYEGMSDLTLGYLLNAIAKYASLGKLSFPTLKVIKPGKKSGRLVGGNMTLIVNMLGTSYEIETKDKILFLEDVDEDLDSIIKYLKAMKKAKRFEKMKGLVFGKMVNCFDSKDKEEKARDRINSLFKDLDIPILYGFPSGHIAKRGEPRITLPLGLKATVNSKDLSVTINESGVC